jgi:CDP-glycerol glycerophosphotransferase (TagB/SpsB family)
MGLDKVGREYKSVVCSSELSIRLLLGEMTIPYKKYINLGMCRNDNLLDGNKYEELRESIINRVSYKVNTIVLYTPTHRDYEESLDNQNARSILGFNYDPVSFESYLRDNGIVFICKLHPKQNAQIVERDIPEGLILHTPNETYGLTELMQISDCLVTDYTSAYLDYLFLDKPVIFNFYDLEKYSRLRGVPFVPMDSIAAGEIVENEGQLKRALTHLDENYKNYKSKREFVRNLFFTYVDNHSCERVYGYFFKDDEDRRKV